MCVLKIFNLLLMHALCKEMHTIFGRLGAMSIIIMCCFQTLKHIKRYFNEGTVHEKLYFKIKYFSFRDWLWKCFLKYNIHICVTKIKLYACDADLRTVYNYK
jgi:hypothetical protein